MTRNLAHALSHVVIATISDEWRDRPETELTSSVMEELITRKLDALLGNRSKVIQALLDDLPRTNREEAMVITKLEEAQMWLEKPMRDIWRGEAQHG